MVNNNIEKIDPKDLKNLAALVKAETLWEPEKWKIAVAYVIKNRIIQSWKNIWDVIFKKTNSWKAEFSPVDDWRLNKMKKLLVQSDYDLIKKVLKNEIPNPISNATFFQNKYVEKKYNTWQERAEKKWKLKTIATIWNHIFRAIT